MLGANLTVVATKQHWHMVGPTTTNHGGNDRMATVSDLLQRRVDAGALHQMKGSSFIANECSSIKHIRIALSHLLNKINV
jgi:hypothetical protein